MLTNQTRAALVQLLTALSPDAVRLLLLKHLNIELGRIDVPALLDILSTAAPAQTASLLVELVGGRTAIRTDAPTKYVFDGRLEELRARLKADGYDVVEDALVTLVPASQPLATITDAFHQILGTTNIDGDGEIRRLLRESHDDGSASPPDLNGSTTKARVALETVVRRAAVAVATKRSTSPSEDRWGPALSFLRHQGVISSIEEDALAKVYTLISPGAHVPAGLDDEEWALLSRAFSVSGAYFMVQKYRSV